MKKNRSNRTTDQGKLFITVGSTIIHVKFIWNAIGGNGIFKNLLKVSCIIIVEKFAAYKQSGMVINDHDTVDTATFTIFGDMGKIAGISLPQYCCTSL